MIGTASGRRLFSQPGTRAFEVTVAGRDETARLHVGAEPTTDGGVAFRVWAPRRRRVAIVVDGRDETVLEAQPDGYFAGRIEELGPGALYRFRLDSDERLYPDPASRSQPDGPHGPSRVIDPTSYAWRDGAWSGLGLKGRIIYEMHVGTFTPEGTWAAAAAKLPHLADLGIDLVEMMPVADFAGRFGWGYDGVNLFAPTRLYGEPDDLRRFVDDAHALGIGVILDVVYNHLGPNGNYLGCFSPAYFTDRYATEWGEAINFDGPASGPVRDFFTANAAYWIREFHFDGLRLDATQSIFDSSSRHVIADMAAAARRAAGPRQIVIVAENEPQETRLVRSVEAGGFGLDALWNDDLHHSAMVALTGRAEAYYEDHAGAPQEFVSAARHGYLFQGQHYAHQAKPRGSPGLDLEPAAFVTFVQNHDQVANSDSGLRFHELSHPGLARAMTALILLGPGTPMLFQGQEFWSSRPFFYFCDHGEELARLVRDGRSEFLSQFPSVGGTPELRARLRDPGDPDTFARSRIDWSEVESHAGIVALHRDLIALRRRDPVFSRQEKSALDGAVIGPDTFLLRFFGGCDGDRLLLFNFGRDFVRRSIPDPLVAPPPGGDWSLAWSSERPAYGGHGAPPATGPDGWRLAAYSATVLTAGAG